MCIRHTQSRFFCDRIRARSVDEREMRQLPRAALPADRRGLRVDRHDGERQGAEDQAARARAARVQAAVSSLQFALAAMLLFGLGDLIYKRGAAAGAPAHQFLMVQSWLFAPSVVAYAICTDSFRFVPGSAWRDSSSSSASTTSPPACAPARSASTRRCSA